MEASEPQIETKKMGRNALCRCGSGKRFKQCCGRLASTSAGSLVWSIPTALQAALEHHQAGRLPQAEAHYRQILHRQPNHSDALHYLGVIACQSGQHDIAVELIRKAISANPLSPIYYNNLGNALNGQGKPDGAIASFLQALSFKPDFAEAHYNLGNALRDQGKLDAAIASYQKALLAKPDFAAASNNLGTTLKAQGKLDEAIASYRRALSFKPDFADAHNNLGIALKAHGKLDEAITSFLHALSLKPDYAEAHYNLGNALRDQGKSDAAVSSYQRALSFKPDLAEAHYNLGLVLQKNGKPDEAIVCHRRALSLKPDYAEAYNNWGAALLDQGKRDDAVALYRKALSVKPDYAGAYSNLLYATQLYAMESPAKVIQECEQFAAHFEAPLRPQWQRHRNIREPGRRLKVGYVSGDFRRHAVAYFIEPVLARHDKGQVEIFCYYSHTQHDEFSERLKGYSDHWLNCKSMTDDQLAERIRCDGIDILVDLSGHTAHNRLLTFARKPAPIQITYLGFQGNNGLAAMDYRLTDAYIDPAGSEASCTEKLLRLPDSLWCHRPGNDMPEIQVLPARQNGYMTFGSFNNFSKIDKQCVELWARLLRAVPDARLLMVTVPEGESRRQLTEQFASLQVSAQRLLFHARLPPSEFYRVLQQADLALDPVSVHGATTTCESLWLGVPVVSLVGTRFAARFGLGILSAAGLQEFAATSAEEYIKIAVNVAKNVPRLAQLRAGLRARMAGSPLMDEVKITRSLEKIYRDVWAKWCNTVT